MRCFAFLLCCLLPLLSLACAGKKGLEPPAGEIGALDSADREEVDIRDPGGPIAAPRLPADLARHAPADMSRHAPADMTRYAPADMSQNAPADMTRYAPADMSQNAPAADKAQKTPGSEGRKRGGDYPYSLECLILSAPPSRQGRAGMTGPGGPDGPGGPGEPGGPDSSAKAGKTGKTGKNDKDDEALAALQDSFAANSSLGRLLDTPPQNLAGLERRLALSLEEGRDMLRSQGWYAGRADGEIAPPGRSLPAADANNGNRGGKGGSKSRDKATVRVTFSPGQRFVTGPSRILADLPAMKGEDAARAAKNLPRSLADAGLPQGTPAVAAEVLAAVERAREAFLNNGFPFARVASTRFIADRSKACLEAEVTISPGPFVRMGDIELKGDIPVRAAYVEAMRQWKKGRPWDQRRIEALRDALRQSGLFQGIDIEAAPDDKKGLRPVIVTLNPAPARTLGGALKYHTDFGPGLQGAWEHRNLTGKGDSLRLAAPLWLDMQELSAAYRLPFFLRRDQDFIANAGLLNQNTDAYRLSSAAASAGLQRRFSRFVTGSVQGAAQGGNIKEPDQPARDYHMYGLPMTLVYDSTRSLLDASSGQRLMASVAPYTGSYNSEFTVLRARLEGRAFLPLSEGETLVMAFKGVVGAVGGDHADNLPPSVRFYSGGGGSVRGYEYQSIGPRNEDDKALGGGSLLEVSSEARWKITPEWGLVAFVDGGSVYEDVFADPGQVMRFGAGLGLRYYTAIGPVRVDAATPLNPRGDDDPLQLYISIGQSF